MPLSRSRRRTLVFALLVVSFLGALDHTVVSTSLATIAGELGALELLGWIVVGYTLASTVLLPVIGKLGDTIGPRAVFITSLVVFLSASLACGFASSMPLLITARIVQGMSSAGIQLMSQTIIAQVTSPRERPQIMAIVGSAFPIAILVGPLLGGLITDYWGWQWIFWINLPVGVLALILAAFVIPRVEAPPRDGFDLAGALTFTVLLVSVVLAVTWFADPRMLSAALGATGVAVAAGIVLLVVETRTHTPLVPIRFFKNRTVAAGTALSAVIGIGLFSVTAYLPTYIQMAYRTSATVSGLVPIATVFGMLVSNLASGALVSRSGHYRLYPIAGTTLGALGLFAMSMIPVGAPLWLPMILMFLVGIGTGSFMNLIIAVVQNAVPRHDVGSITATVNLSRQVGSTITTAIIGAIVGFGVAAKLPPGLDAATLTPQTVHAASADIQGQIADIYAGVFAPVFFGLAVVYALGIIAALLLPHERLPAESNEIGRESADPETAHRDPTLLEPIDHPDTQSPELRSTS